MCVCMCIYMYVCTCIYIYICRITYGKYGVCLFLLSGTCKVGYDASTIKRRLAAGPRDNRPIGGGYTARELKASQPAGHCRPIYSLSHCPPV